MPAYHSAFNNDPSVQTVGNTGLVPFNATKARGAAPIPADPSQPDIIEEALDLTLIYLILFISDCIAKLAPTAGRPSPGYGEAGKKLHTLAVDSFALPGEAGFPLNSMYHPPANRNEADMLRSYLTHARTELALRLVDRLYPEEQVLGPDGQPTGQVGPRAAQPSKWWMAFQKRRFMGRSLSS
ncbi:arp2/3 complex 21 kda subunit (p21-arc) [Trichosporon asahii var. asahii CBS 8904]|uniref:Actin-related protein 2/3 complex subunit 3 n=1 Tax=Trichosporon asahii var. asahii (strain CBS 8904) TaxID=1220162 RepID=K1VJ59_TRIAC|nr:arp2/3 complex 21 kda subunit (p21-arc) [Trichosporon asahii var. asahii CBS 8904]